MRFNTDDVTHLTVCGLPGARSGFTDRLKNNSEIWHFLLKLAHRFKLLCTKTLGYCVEFPGDDDFLIDEVHLAIVRHNRVFLSGFKGFPSLIL